MRHENGNHQDYFYSLKDGGVDKAYKTYTPEDIGSLNYANNVLIDILLKGRYIGYGNYEESLDDFILAVDNIKGEGFVYEKMTNKLKGLESFLLTTGYNNERADLVYIYFKDLIIQYIKIHYDEECIKNPHSIRSGELRERAKILDITLPPIKVNQENIQKNVECIIGKKTNGEYWDFLDKINKDKEGVDIQSFKKMSDINYYTGGVRNILESIYENNYNFFYQHVRSHKTCIFISPDLAKVIGALLDGSIQKNITKELEKHGICYEDFLQYYFMNPKILVENTIDALGKKSTLYSLNTELLLQMT
ncbi:MAG: hypothetical protein GY828_01260 [Candidatus Gracilibacteria bacterium]|nr:hypothetical protein [Candidatus Gracilibacteria bacterium]